MTTTGGRGDLDLSAPEVPALDGDDITVVPDAPASRSRGRMRALLVGALVVVLAGAAVAVAVINRDDDDSTLSSISTRKSPPTIDEPSAIQNPPQAPVKPRASAPTTVGTVPNATPTTVNTPVATPTLPTTPAITPEYPPSMLTWQATPAALTVKAGEPATVSVTVTNPTDGNITLGQPLTCAPVVQPEHGGGPIGNGVCVALAQVMTPLQTLTQQHTIYATQTGDASGAPLGVGRYTVRFENLYSIWMTVTAI